MEEFNNFQQEPDETLYQAWECFKELLMKCPQHYLTEMQEVILFYNGLDIPTRQILDSRGAIPTKTGAYAKTAIQEIAEYTQKWHNGTSRGRSIETSDGLAAIQEQLNNLGREIKKRHEENSNLIKEIRAMTDAAIRNQRASIKTLEIQIGKMSKVLQERGFGSLPSLTETNPRDKVKSISTTIKADSYPIRRIISSQYAISTGQNNTLLYKSRQMTVPFPSRLNNHCCEEEEENCGPKFTKAYGHSHINYTIPQKEKDQGSFTLPCFDNALVDLGASVSVMPLSTYLNLGLGKLAHTRLTMELADRTVKYPKGIAENVLVGIGKFTFPVDFIILDMPEDIKVPLILESALVLGMTISLGLWERDLVINRSLDPVNEDYIELNDLNEPFELRRNQGDDLMPTIEEGEVIEEFRTRDEDLDTVIDYYPSYYDNDKKIHIDCANNLKFSCMIGFEFTHVNVFLLLYVNIMSQMFHNSVMKEKVVYKGNNVVGALMNVPIFVGTFSVVVMK
ncbi:hypothetical protein Tco_0345358 [Tanacetum coccineum]